MKNLLLAFLAITLLLLTGCDNGEVTSSEVIGRCDEISGTYSGEYHNTSCNGSVSSDIISSYTITDGCSAEIIGEEGIILKANGLITGIDENGDSFNIRVDTPPNSSCGGLTGSCNSTGTDAYHCTYTWDNGGDGTLDITKD